MFLARQNLRRSYEVSVMTVDGEEYQKRRLRVIGVALSRYERPLVTRR
jgi:hypothetical protein